MLGHSLPKIGIALALFLLLVSVPAFASILPPRERSRSLTLEVPSGRSEGVGGGLGYNTTVYGMFEVRSCCGFSTNDIKFGIEGDLYEGKFYGVVSGNFSFVWNSGRDDSYFLRFENRFADICGQQGCLPDPSHPSHHNKTISLTLREVAAPIFTSSLGPILYVVPVVVGVGVAITLGFILVERRKSKKLPSADETPI